MNIRELEVPAKAFTQHFLVPASDIDELGHAGNVSWVRWVGEVAAAHIAGILTLESAARVICVRSALLRRIDTRG